MANVTSPPARLGAVLVRAGGVGAERGQHLLAQREREVADEVAHGSAVQGSGRLARALAELDLDGPALAVAEDLERDLVAGVFGR